MPACQICKHAFKTLKFQTEHIDICTRCVNTLNESPEPAYKAQERLAELLARGMRRNAEIDLESPDEWRKSRAQWTLNNFEAAVSQALPGWITKLLANRKNSTRDFKIMRAHRRGLLRMDGFSSYPNNWVDVARSIRVRDRMCCTECGTIDSTLDVHHIIYLSKHGTNQQHNLTTLCRQCHQEEHDTIFDEREAIDPEPISPIRPPPWGEAQHTNIQPSSSQPISELVKLDWFAATQAERSNLKEEEDRRNTRILEEKQLASIIEANRIAQVKAEKSLKALIQEKNSSIDKSVQEAKNAFNKSLEPWLKAEGHKAGLGYGFIWFIGTAFLFIGGFKAKDSSLIFCAFIGLAAYMFTADGPKEKYMNSEAHRAKLKGLEDSVTAQMRPDSVITVCPGCRVECNVKHAEHTFSDLLTCTGCKQNFHFQDFINATPVRRT